MITPDTIPTVSADEVISYLKDKKDFIYEGDSKFFSGLNSEFAYVVRYGDLAICILCVHGQLYVRKTPRENWPAGVMLSVIMAYGMGLISTEDQITCTDEQMTIACIAHGVQDNSATDVPQELLDLASEYMRKPE